MKLAKPLDKYSQINEAQARGEIEREDARNVKRDAALPFLLMPKPDGTVGRLTISSAGVPVWAPL